MKDPRLFAFFFFFLPCLFTIFPLHLHGTFFRHDFFFLGKGRAVWASEESRSWLRRELIYSFLGVPFGLALCFLILSFPVLQIFPQVWLFSFSPLEVLGVFPHPNWHETGFFPQTPPQPF